MISLGFLQRENKCHVAQEAKALAEDREARIYFRDSRGDSIVWAFLTLHILCMYGIIILMLRITFTCDCTSVGFY